MQVELHTMADLTFLFNILVDAVRWMRQLPNHSYVGSPSRNNQAESFAGSTQTRSLNVGGLSDAIMNSLRPSMNLRPLPTNRNNRGSCYLP